MEPLQKFNIPKIKGVTHREGHIQKVSLSSRDSIILLEDIKKCCLDITYCDQIEVLEILMIHNSELNKSYTAKKSEIRGRSNVSFKEDYGFLCHRIPMRDIAKCGLSIGNITFNGLGESRCGIYLSRYFDVELESSFFSDVKEIFIFKYIAGKSKSVKISFNNNLEPTPNFDSHVSSVPPNVSDSLYTQTNRSKIYLYEYTDDCVPAKYPRHCLPYAVLKVRKLPKCLRTTGLQSKPLTYSSTLTTKDVSQTCPPVKKKKKNKSSKDSSTSFKISLEKSSTLTDGLESPTNKVPKPYQPLLPPEPSGISQSDKNAKNTENNTNATKFSQKCVDPRLRALNSIPQNPFPSALQQASCALSLNSSSWSGYKHQTLCKPIVSCLKTNSKSESKKIKEKKKISLSDYKKKKETNSDCTESDLATTAEKQNSSEGNVPACPPPSDHLNQSKFESADVSQRNGLELTSHPALAILNEDSNQSRLCPAPVAQIRDSNIDNGLTHSPLLSCLKKRDSQSKLCSAEESTDGKEKCDVLLSSRFNNGSSKAKVCTTISAKKQNSEVCVTTCAPSLDHLNQSNFDSACVPQRQGSTDSITAISQPSIVIISQTQDYKGSSHKLCSADEAARLESKESKEATDISLSNHSSKAKIYPANAAKKQESESIEVIVATSSSQLGPNQSKPNTTQVNIPKVLTKDTLASDSPTEVRPDYLLAVNLTVCTDIDPLTETEIPGPSIYLSSDDDDEEDEEYSSWSYYEDSSDESLPSIPCQSRSCTPTDSCRSVFSAIDAFPPSPSDNYFLASPSIDPYPLSSQLPLCLSSPCPSPTSCGSKQHSSEYKPSSSSISAQPSNIPPTPSSDVTSATQSLYVRPTPASDVTSATQSSYVRSTPASDVTSAKQSPYVRPTPASDITSAKQSPYVRPTPASDVTSATQTLYVGPTPASNVTSATQSPYVRSTPASDITSAKQSPYVRPTPASDVTSATQSPYVRLTSTSDVTSATQTLYVGPTPASDVTSAKQSPYVRPTPASDITSAKQSPYVRPTPASDVTSATQSSYVRPTPASDVTSATQSPYVRSTPASDITSAKQSPYVRPTPASDVTSATQSPYVRLTSTSDVTSATQTLYVGPTPASDVTSVKQSPYVRPTPASDITSAKQSPYVRPTPASDVTSATQSPYVRPTPASDITSAKQSPYVRPTPASDVTSTPQTPYVGPTPASDVTSAKQSPYVRPTPVSDVTSAKQSPYVRPTPASDVTSAKQSPYVRPTPASDVTSAKQSPYVRPTPTSDITSAKQSPYVRPTPASDVTSATQSSYVRPTPASDVTSATQSPYVRPTPASDITSAKQSPYVRPTPASDVTSATQSSYVRPTPASDFTSATQSPYVRPTPASDITSAKQSPYVRPTPASDITSAKQSPCVRPSPASDVISTTQTPYVGPTPASDVTSAKQSPYVRPTPASDITSAKQSPYVRPTPASDITSAKQSPYVRPTPASDVTSTPQTPYVGPTPASDVTSAKQSPYVRPTPVSDVTSAKQSPYVRPTPASDVTSAKQSPYVRPTPASDVTSAKQSPYVRPTPTSDITSAKQSPYVRPTPASDVTSATQSSYVRPTPASDVTSATQSPYVRPTPASDITSAKQSPYVRPTPASDVASATQSSYVRPTPASDFTSATQSPYVRPTPTSDITSAKQSPYVRPTPASDVTSAKQSPCVRPSPASDVISTTQTPYVGPTPASDVTSAKQSPYVRPTPASDITSAKQSPYVRPIPASDVTSTTQSPYVRPTPASDVTSAKQSPYVGPTPASDVTSAKQSPYVRPTPASDVTSVKQSPYVRPTSASDVTSAKQSPYVRPTPASDVTSAKQSPYVRPTPACDVTSATPSPHGRPIPAPDFISASPSPYVRPTLVSDVTSATQSPYVRPTPASDVTSATQSPYVKPTLASDVTSVLPSPASDQHCQNKPSIYNDPIATIPSPKISSHIDTPPSEAPPCLNLQLPPSGPITANNIISSHPTLPSSYPTKTLPSQNIPSFLELLDILKTVSKNEALPPSGSVAVSTSHCTPPVLDSPSQNITNAADSISISLYQVPPSTAPISTNLAGSSSKASVFKPILPLMNSHTNVSSPVSHSSQPPSNSLVHESSVSQPTVPLSFHQFTQSAVSYPTQPAPAFYPTIKYSSFCPSHLSSITVPVFPHMPKTHNPIPILKSHPYFYFVPQTASSPIPIAEPSSKVQTVISTPSQVQMVPVSTSTLYGGTPSPQVTLTALSSQPATSLSSNPEAYLPSQPTRVLPSQSTTSLPSQPTRVLPFESMTLLPSQPTRVLPSQPMMLLPSQSTTSSPSQPTRALPSQSITSLQSQSTTSSPSQSTRVLPPQSTASSPSHPMTSLPSQPISLSPQNATSCSQDLDNIIKSYNDPICISSGGEDMDEPSQKNIKLIEIQANNLKKKMKDSWSKNERKHIEELDPKIEKLVQHIAQFSNSTVNASLIKSKIHEKFKSQCFYESILKSTKLKDAVPSKCDDYYKYRCPSPAQTDYVVNRLTGKQATTSDCIIISGSSSNVSCCDVDVQSECLAVNSSTTPSSDLDVNSGYISISDTDSTPGHVTQSRSTASSIASFTSTDRNHFIKKLYQEKTSENQNQSAKHDTSPEAHSSGPCVQHSESYLTNAPLEALHLAKDTILKEIHLLEATYLSQEENMDNGQECPLSDTTEDTLHPPVSSLETVKDIFSQKKAKINNSRTIQKSNGSLLVQCVNDSLDALLEIDYSTPEQSESLKNKKHEPGRELHDAYGHNSASNSLFLNASTFDSDLRVTVLGPDSPNTDCMPSRKVNKKRKWSQADEKQSLQQKRTKLVSVVSNEHLAIKKQMTKNKYFMKKGDNKKSNRDIDKSKSIIAGTTRSSSLERSKNNISLDSHEKKSLLNKPDKTNVNDSIKIAKEDSLVDETDTSSSVERTRESMSVEEAKIKSSFKRSIITSPSSKTRTTSPLKSGNKRIYTPHDCRSFKFQPSHRSASMSPNRSYKHWSSRRSLKSRSPKRKKNFIDSKKSSKSSVEKTSPDVQHSLSQPHKTVHKKSIVDELLNIYNQPPSQSGSASSLHKSSDLDLDFYIPRKETSVKGQDLTVKMFVFLQIGFLFQEDSPFAIPFPVSTILNSQDSNPQQQKNMGDEIMKACSAWFDLPSNAFVGRNFIYDIPLSMADRSHVEKFSTQQFYLESKLIGQCHSFLMLEEKDGTLSGDTLEQVLQGFEKKRIKIVDLISDIENIAQKLKDNNDPLTTPELTQQVLQLESELTSAVAEYTSSQSHTSNTLKLLILDTLPDLTKVPLLGFTFKSPSLKLMDSHLQNIKHSFEVVTKDFIQTFHSVNFGHAHYPVPEQLLLESEVEELYAKRSCCFILSASIPPQDFKTLFQLRCKIESILKTASDSSDSKKDELVQLTNERAKLLQRYVGHQSSTRKDKLEVLFNNFLITQNYIKKIIGADGLVQMPLFNSLLKATENHFKLLEEAMEKKKPS